MSKSIHLVTTKKLWGLNYYIDSKDQNNHETNSVLEHNDNLASNKLNLKTQIFGGDRFDKGVQS